MFQYLHFFVFYTVETDNLPSKIKGESPKTILSLFQNTFLLLNYAG